MEEIRIDVKKQTPEELTLASYHAKLVHRFNMAEPYSEEWTELMHEIFKGKIGEGSLVMSPLTAVRPHMVSIGNNVIVMNGCLMMSAGGITIEDDARIAANTQIISNNHDPYNRDVITCKPVVIRKGASVVTKDVPDYAVAVGNPARIIKYLEKDKFNE